MKNGVLTASKQGGLRGHLSPEKVTSGESLRAEPARHVSGAPRNIAAICNRAGDHMAVLALRAARYAPAKLRDELTLTALVYQGARRES